MKFKTETGSIYEVDETNKQIRRITGVKAPTPRQGQDGEWKSYESLTTLPDKSMYITWYTEIVDGELIRRGTLTSRIVENLPDPN